jgi:putative transposase
MRSILKIKTSNIFKILWIMKDIFRHTKLQGSLILRQILLKRGQKMESFDISELMMEEKECIMLTTLKKYLELNIQIKYLKIKYVVMQEFHQIIKKKILVDKLKSYKKLTLGQKSFPTLVLALILKERDLKPFWNEYTKEISKKLWLPIKTDSVDSDLKLWNGSLKNQMQNSWFSTLFQKATTNQEQQNLQKTCCQSQQFLLPEIMEIDQQDIGEKEKKVKTKKKEKKNENKQKNEKENEEKEFKSIKLRIYPDNEQKKILRKWFGVSRYIYNKCLFHIKNGFDKKEKDVLNIKNLRSLFINNDNYKETNTWVNEIPYDIRDESLRNLIKNYKSNFAKGEPFNIRFKNKKDTISINVLSKHWNNDNGIYSKVFTSKTKCEKPLPSVINHTCQIIKNQLNEYYICIPIQLDNENLREDKKSSTNENQVSEIFQEFNDKKIISIDPGVRTFATGYDPNGVIIKSGDYDIALLSRLLHYKSKLQSKITTIENHSTRYKMKKAYKRLAKRIQNLVDDCHKKLSKWLCENYDIILIPRMSFHTFDKMSRKNKNKMIVWKHCSFVDRLVYKSREYNCKVIEVTEDYTSKTCGNCGYIKYNLKSSKTFCCDICKSKIDRDTNGARNILLKYATSKRVV